MDERKSSQNDLEVISPKMVKFNTVADPGFLRRGAPTPEVGALTYYLAKFFPKTAWKWKKLDLEGARPWRPP